MEDPREPSASAAEPGDAPHAAAPSPMGFPAHPLLSSSEQAALSTSSSPSETAAVSMSPSPAGSRCLSPAGSRCLSPASRASAPSPATAGARRVGFSQAVGHGDDAAPGLERNLEPSCSEENSGPRRQSPPDRQISRQKSTLRRHDSKYALQSVPRPQLSMKAVAAAAAAQLREPEEGEHGQEAPRAADLSRIQRAGEGDDLDGAASSVTTAPTHQGSVMSNDLGGFYRKLLGDDWREQIEEMNQENLLGAFDEADEEEAASPGGAAAAHTADDDLNLPDKHHGKVRQRIRRRDVVASQDISDQVADDLHLGEDEEPLITPEDIAEIRASAWIPAGEGLPVLSEMELGYHRAWDVGKKGCLAVKVDGIWDSAVKGNKMRFFVMDGTDAESFLTFYSKSDLQAARGMQSEKLGIITAWDMRDGYWNYAKKKVFIQRSDRKNRECILEGFTTEFYDAMLLCIWEMCVQAAIEQLKHQRRRERNKRRQSLCGGGDASSRAVGRGAETRRVSAALVAFKDIARGEDGGHSRYPSPDSKKGVAEMREAAAAHREVMKQLCAEWRSVFSTRIQEESNPGRRLHRKDRKRGEGESPRDIKKREKEGKSPRMPHQYSMKRTVSRPRSRKDWRERDEKGSAPSSPRSGAAAGRQSSRDGLDAAPHDPDSSSSVSSASVTGGRREDVTEEGDEGSTEKRETDLRDGEGRSDGDEQRTGDDGSESDRPGGRVDRDGTAGSREFGEIRRQLLKFQSHQRQMHREQLVNGGNSGEAQTDGSSSQWRAGGTRRISSLPLEDLSRHQAAGVEYRQAASMGTGGGRGRKKSLAASKRGPGSAAGGYANKLSKYETLNRVPPARPQGNETPLLTPGEKTPRDPEDERPMFG
ncbi:hypothetical protein BESB_070610 [Besnoitia besnoiti]|uniref:Uncharacterized protein n=1 Tax=Besnoitia besnoiti TaxID=94643 RepID=A0A2A9M7J7_BESBE|nr:uncharacterized protein BESB_070610 [Besnoitia besnoiti]PFH33909.1 hypothetical protein BESB_070610 [Besnoitia besnoiti]